MTSSSCSLFSVSLSGPPLSLFLFHFELHQEKISLRVEEREKILLCELFRGESRLRFCGIVQTTVCHINGIEPVIPAAPAAMSELDFINMFNNTDLPKKRFQVSEPQQVTFSRPAGVCRRLTLLLSGSYLLRCECCSLFRGSLDSPEVHTCTWFISASI